MVCVDDIVDITPVDDGPNGNAYIMILSTQYIFNSCLFNYKLDYSMMHNAAWTFAPDAN